MFQPLSRRLGPSLRLFVSVILTLLACDTRAAVVINEICADNSTSLAPNATTPDYVELHNNGVSSVDISGWTLTDKPTEPNRFVFPSGTVLAGGAYVIVWFSGESILPTAGLGLHSTNTLSADGETVQLYMGAILQDTVPFGLQLKDKPIARIPNGTGVWTLSTNSPGAANTVSVPLGTVTALRFNEWMATNSAGDDKDWVELYNPPTNGPVSVAGLFVSDETGAPNEDPIVALSFIESGDFFRFWCDKDPDKGANHLDLSLSSTSGETLSLYQPNGSTIIDRVIFPAQTQNIAMGRLPDGSTNIVYFSPAGRDTPGDSNFLPVTNVVVNEVLAHTDPPLQDAIEFYNPGTTNVDIGNWWLSNSRDTPQKYRIPAGTIVPAGGYKVIYESAFNVGVNAFTFNSARGDQANIASADASGNLTGFITTRDFPASENGVSFGRFVKADGGTDFVPMSTLSLGSAITAFSPDTQPNRTAFEAGPGATNVYPLVGPVVVSEIMYHPPDIGTNDNSIDEFIEIRNLTASPVLLYDNRRPDLLSQTNTWHLRGIVDFDLPMNTSIPALGHLLFVNFDPVTNTVQLAAFRSKYNVPAGVQIFGPYKGKLDNASGTVELQRPDAVQPVGRPDAGLVPYIFVERVSYKDSAPWPANTDGTGNSVQRRSFTGYSNDETNWFGAAPTAGADFLPPTIITSPDSRTFIAGETLSLNVAATGNDLAFRWFFNGGQMFGNVTSNLSLAGASPGYSGNYLAVVTNALGMRTSAVAVVTVLAAPLPIAPQATGTTSSNGQFQFRVQIPGMAGRTQVVENSPDLQSWSTLATVTSAGATVTDTPTNAPRRFYRTRLLP